MLAASGQIESSEFHQKVLDLLWKGSSLEDSDKDLKNLFDHMELIKNQTLRQTETVNEYIYYNSNRILTHFSHMISCLLQ